jgi:hypothetical protein
MPTKREPTRRPWHRGRMVVTAEMLELWRRAKKLRKSSDAYKAAEMVLQKLIGLSKFEASPLGRGSLLGGDTTSPPQAERWRDALERANREQPETTRASCAERP